jgi:hypothetical protein
MAARISTQVVARSITAGVGSNREEALVVRGVAPSLRADAMDREAGEDMVLDLDMALVVAGRDRLLP